MSAATARSGAGELALLAVVGASWGGFSALGRFVERLDPVFPGAAVLVQHRGADSPEGVLLGHLRRLSPLPVDEVDDKDPIEPSRVYLAPADYHLLVEPGRFALSTDAPVRFSRPSIDVAMETAADAYGPATVAVVLTGGNDDGCRGAAAVRAAGGTVVVQDPDTAEKATMPAAVVAAGLADLVLDLDDIPAALGELANRP